MKKQLSIYLIVVGAFGVFGAHILSQKIDLGSCFAYAFRGFRDVATDRAQRFLGKVEENTARCRGGDAAAAWQKTPWLDWQRYPGAAGKESLVGGFAGKLGFLSPNRRGISGALLDLE